MDILLTLEFLIALFVVLVALALSFGGAGIPTILAGMSERRMLRIIACVLSVVAYCVLIRYSLYYDIFSGALVEKNEGAAFGVLYYVIELIIKANDVVIGLFGNLNVADSGIEQWKLFLLNLVITIVFYILLVVITRTGDQIMDNYLKEWEEAEKKNAKKEKKLYLETDYSVDHNGDLSSRTRIVDKTKYEITVPLSVSFVILEFLSVAFMPGPTLILLVIASLILVLRKK